MLHKAESAQPEDCETWNRKGTPVTVQVALNSLMEDTIATKRYVIHLFFTP